MPSPAFSQNLRVGLDALRENPLRAVLSTLGVIIGVGSLVAVLSVGDGLESTMRSQLATTTSLQYFNVVPVTTEEVEGQQFPLDAFPRFTVDDARDAAGLPGLDGMTAEVRARGEARDSIGRVRRLVAVNGVTESWFTLAPVTLRAGRALDAADVNDTTALVTASSRSWKRPIPYAPRFRGGPTPGSARARPVCSATSRACRRRSRGCFSSSSSWAPSRAFHCSWAASVS